MKKPLQLAFPPNIHHHRMSIDKVKRSRLKCQAPCVLWLTGISGAGKSTIANLVEQKMYELGYHTYLLDGDSIRHGINYDLGFSHEDRSENIRRVAEIARLMLDAGLIVITAFISPFRAERQMARNLFECGEFIEIHINTPLAVAEARDPKGLYKKARQGKIKNFTGIDSPYDVPIQPEIIIDTTAFTPEGAAEFIISSLSQQGLIRFISLEN